MEPDRLGKLLAVLIVLAALTSIAVMFYYRANPPAPDRSEALR